MITNRDQDIINTLENFKSLNSSQIHRLFFKSINPRYTRLRLQYLADKKYIFRTDNAIGCGYSYYIDKKPSLVRHNLFRSEIYTQLQATHNIQYWNNRLELDGVIPDAVAIVEDNGIEFTLFIEIHLREEFDFKKYVRLSKSTSIRQMFKNPRVVVVTDKKLNIPPDSGFRYKIISLDMKSLNTIFK